MDAFGASKTSEVDGVISLSSQSAPSYGSSGRYSGSGLAPSLNIYAPSYKTAGTTSGYGSDYGRGSRPSSGYGSGYGSDYGKSTGSGYISDYGRSGGGYASDYGNRNSGYGSDYNRYPFLEGRSALARVYMVCAREADQGKLSSLLRMSKFLVNCMLKVQYFVECLNKVHEPKRSSLY